MNFIRGNLSLEKIEREQGVLAAKRQCLLLLTDYARRHDGVDEWVVVFDGPDDEATDVAYPESLYTIYGEDRSADEIIRERAFDALAVGDAVAIVSNDREVRIEGAAHTRVEEFYATLIRRIKVERDPATDAGLQKFLAGFFRGTKQGSHRDSPLDGCAPGGVGPLAVRDGAG